VAAVFVTPVTPETPLARALTVRNIEAVKPGKARTEIADGAITGLYLVVQPSGAKSWAVRYRLHGRPRQADVGPLSCAWARRGP